MQFMPNWRGRCINHFVPTHYLALAQAPKGVGERKGDWIGGTKDRRSFMKWSTVITHRNWKFHSISDFQVEFPSLKSPMPIPWCSEVENSSPSKRFLRVLFCFVFCFSFICYVSIVCCFFLLVNCNILYLSWSFNIYTLHETNAALFLSYPVSRHADDLLNRFIIGNLVL